MCAAVATAPEPESSRRLVSHKLACSHCGRSHSIRNREGKAYTWKCPHCGTVNAGPGLIAEMTKPGDPGRRRRIARRGAYADGQAAPAEPASSPVAAGKAQPAVAAPVRLKRSPAPARGGGDEAAPSSRPARRHPEPPPPAPEPPRRGFLSRALGFDDEDAD